MKTFFATILLGIILLFTSCSNDQDYEVGDDKAYVKSAENMAEKERKHPEKFFTVQASTKKNLLGQTVVRGTIYNKAKVIALKDFEIKLRFFSKTGALLEEDTETIYEDLNAGASTKFKSKYFTPKGSDSLSIIPISAKPVQ